MIYCNKFKTPKIVSSGLTIVNRKETRLRNSYYSPFRIVQICDILECIHKYCKDKSETFTEFFTSLVVIKAQKMILTRSNCDESALNELPYRESSCKRDVTLANLYTKSVVVSDSCTFQESFAANVFPFFTSFVLMQIKSILMSIHIF